MEQDALCFIDLLIDWLIFIKYYIHNKSFGLHWWDVTKMYHLCTSRKENRMLCFVGLALQKVTSVWEYNDISLSPEPCGRSDARWKTLSGCVGTFEAHLCFVSCHCYFWPKWAVKRFMAVTCTHSYSFVSIETLRAGQPCILELHKALPIIRHTIWCGISHLNGFLF